MLIRSMSAPRSRSARSASFGVAGLSRSTEFDYRAVNLRDDEVVIFATHRPRPALDLARCPSDRALERRGCVTAPPVRRRRPRAIAGACSNRGPFPDREIATDHAAVTVDQAVGDAVHMLGQRPRGWGWVHRTIYFLSLRATALRAIAVSLNFRSSNGNS